jgi:hypothetical protein
MAQTSGPARTIPAGDHAQSAISAARAATATPRRSTTPPASYPSAQTVLPGAHRHGTTRVSIPVHGEIDTGLETYTSTGLAGGAWLSVRTGPVLTYCEHPDHATRRAAAWNAAILPGRQDLPREAFLRDLGRDRVIAQVTA